MKVCIVADEWRPCIDVTKKDEWGYDEKIAHEIPDDLIERYLGAVNTINIAHNELAQYLRDNGIKW